MIEGYPEEDIHRGTRYATSPLTGTTYLVTEWVEKGEGRLVAIKKEEVVPAIVEIVSAITEVDEEAA